MNDAIIRLQEGDKNALRPIVEDYQAEIRTLIACKGICRADVDDIAQATFLHVYQHIHDFEAGTNFRAWIRTIALFKTRAFLEERRRQCRNEKKLFETYLINHLDSHTDAQNDDRVTRLAHCLDRLNDLSQNVIEQRYQGIPLTTIAQELERSVPAVKMMLLRIRNQLRKCVEAQA